MKKIKRIKDLKNKTYLEVFRLLDLEEHQLAVLENVDKNFSVISEIEGYQECNFIDFIAKQKNEDIKDVKEQFLEKLNKLVSELNYLNSKYNLDFNL